MTSVDVTRFREVLGHYATGVVVVCALTPDGPAGFTCQNFASLSLEPPLLSFAASRVSTSWLKMRETPLVGVSILAAGQESLARQFATTGVDKFDGFSLEFGPEGAPLLAGVLAHIEGKTMSISTHGDHDVSVVVARYVRSFRGRPLLYYRGGFGELA